MKIWTKLKHKTRLEYILLAFLLISLPLKNSFNTLIIILLAIYSTYNIKCFNLSRLIRYYSFFILFALAVLSLIYTENISLGLRYLEKYSILLVIPFIFSIISFQKEKIFKILLLFSITIIFLTLYCQYYIISSLIENGDSLSSIFNKQYSYLNFSSPVDIHPAYFSLFIIVSILTIFQFIFKCRLSKTHKTLGVFLIIYLCNVIVQLANRTYLLILVFVLNYFAYLILSRTIKKASIKILFFIGINVLFVLSITQFEYTTKRIQQVFGYTYDNGYKHEDGKKKLLQWSAAIGANNSLLFGNGMGDAKESILTEYEKRGYSYYFENNYNAHNQYLETFVGLGIIGLMSLFLIIILGIVRAIKSNIGVYRILYFVIPIIFLTESYLERHHGLVFFVLAYAFIIPCPKDQQS